MVAGVNWDVEEMRGLHPDWICSVDGGKAGCLAARTSAQISGCGLDISRTLAKDSDECRWCLIAAECEVAAELRA